MNIRKTPLVVTLADWICDQNPIGRSQLMRLAPPELYWFGIATLKPVVLLAVAPVLVELIRFVPDNAAFPDPVLPKVDARKKSQIQRPSKREKLPAVDGSLVVLWPKTASARVAVIALGISNEERMFAFVVASVVVSSIEGIANGF
jgi:hypothetical protein